MSIENKALDRLPPHSLEAEQGVLGCCLQDPAASIPAAQERLKDGLAFYDLRHQTVWHTLTVMDAAREGVDLITVRQRLKDAGRLEEVGGVAYLNALVDATASAANLAYYLDIVMEKQVLRKMLATCARVAASIYEREDAGHAETLMDEVEKELMAVGQLREVGVEFDGKALAQAGLDYLELAHRSKGLNMGLSTGFSYLDKMTGGLHGGDMVVLAGRPSTGKSSFAKSIVENVCVTQKVPVGFISLEMSARQLAIHLKFMSAEKDFQMLRTGMWREEDLKSVLLAAPRLAAAPLMLTDTQRMTMAQIRSLARRWVARSGIKLLVIDYMQLIKPATRQHSREQEVSEISASLKALAKELNIPVLVLAQLNREMEKDTLGGGGEEYNRKPRLSDLRESGSIEQDADVVIVLYHPKLREEKRDKETGNAYGFDEAEHVRELGETWREKLGPGMTDAANCKRVNACVIKQREGPQGDVELLFVKGCMKFVDYLRPGSTAGSYIRKPKQQEMPTEEELGEGR